MEVCQTRHPCGKWLRAAMHFNHRQYALSTDGRTAFYMAVPVEGSLQKDKLLSLIGSDAAYGSYDWDSRHTRCFSGSGREVPNIPDAKQLDPGTDVSYYTDYAQYPPFYGSNVYLDYIPANTFGILDHCGSCHIHDTSEKDAANELSSAKCNQLEKINCLDLIEKLNKYVLRYTGSVDEVREEGHFKLSTDTNSKLDYDYFCTIKDESSKKSLKYELTDFEDSEKINAPVRSRYTETERSSKHVQSLFGSVQNLRRAKQKKKAEGISQTHIEAPGHDLLRKFPSLFPSRVSKPKTFRFSRDAAFGNTCLGSRDIKDSSDKGVINDKSEFDDMIYDYVHHADDERNIRNMLQRRLYRSFPKRYHDVNGDDRSEFAHFSRLTIQTESDNAIDIHGDLNIEQEKSPSEMYTDYPEAPSLYLEDDTPAEFIDRNKIYGSREADLELMREDSVIFSNKDEELSSSLSKGFQIAPILTNEELSALITSIDDAGDFEMFSRQMTSFCEEVLEEASCAIFDDQQPVTLGEDIICEDPLNVKSDEVVLGEETEMNNFSTLNDPSVTDHFLELGSEIALSDLAHLDSISPEHGNIYQKLPSGFKMESNIGTKNLCKASFTTLRTGSRISSVSRGHISLKESIKTSNIYEGIDTVKSLDPVFSLPEDKNKNDLTKISQSADFDASEKSINMSDTSDISKFADDHLTDEFEMIDDFKQENMASDPNVPPYTSYVSDVPKSARDCTKDVICDNDSEISVPNDNFNGDVDLNDPCVPVLSDECPQIAKNESKTDEYSASGAVLESVVDQHPYFEELEGNSLSIEQTDDNEKIASDEVEAICNLQPLPMEKVLDKDHTNTSSATVPEDAPSNNLPEEHKTKDLEADTGNDFSKKHKKKRHKKNKEKKHKHHKDEIYEKKSRPLKNFVDKQLKEGFQATVYIVDSKKNATSSVCTVKFNYDDDVLLLQTPSNTFDIKADKMIAEEIPTLPGAPILLKLSIRGRNTSAVVIQSTCARNLEVLGGIIGWANQSSKSQKPRCKTPPSEASDSHVENEPINDLPRNASFKKLKMEDKSRNEDEHITEATDLTEKEPEHKAEKRGILSRVLLRKYIKRNSKRKDV